jgi:molybdate/tungstate transport system substrate-binding protein
LKEIVRYIVCLSLTVVGVVSFPGCGEAEKTKVHIHNAGSLVIPMERLEEEFEKLHPEIDILYEGHGSIQVVRHVTEIGQPIDIAFVADYSLLPLLMYPAEMEDGRNFADWYIQFATNQLGVAYTPESACAGEINQQNWYEILRKPDVNLGFSDPRLDAVGYRSLMLLQLAEDYYRDDTIFDDVVASNFNARIRSVETDGKYDITVPELLESTNDRIYLRGFSVQLLALLESHQVEINLSEESLADNYGRITVKLDYQRYKTVTPVFEGMPIIYGVTIPYSAPHPEEAALFIEFLLGEEGRKILMENYQPPISTPRTDNPSSVPDRLKKFLE